MLPADPVIERYVAALVAAARGQEESLAREAAALAGFAGREPAFASLLADPRLSPGRRREFLGRALAGVSPLLGRLLQALVGRGRGGRAGEVLRLAAAALERRWHAVAEVETGLPLPAARAERLRASLAVRLGRPVEVRARTVPALLAGARISCDDFLFDGSLERVLADLARRALAGAAAAAAAALPPGARP